MEPKCPAWWDLRWQHVSWQEPLVFVATVVSLTGVMGQRFYDQPELGVGRIAPVTIVAPETVTVEDVESTEAKRKAAQTGATPVLKIDSGINQRIYQDLQSLVNQGQVVRRTLGEFPIVALGVMPLQMQLYLREVDEATWLEILAAVEYPGLVGLGAAGVSPQGVNPRQGAIALLRQYRETHTPQDYSRLIQQLSQARDGYHQALELLVEERQTLAQSNPEELDHNPLPWVYQNSFLDLTDGDWQATQGGLYQALEMMLAQGIAQGVPPDVLDRAVRLQVSLTVPPAGEPLAVDLLLRVLQPNLVQDPDRTKLQAEQVAQAVDPVVVSIRAGEAIVTVGDEITQEQLVLLDHFNKSQRSINAWGLGQFGGGVAVAVGIFVGVGRRCYPKVRRRDRLLVLFFVLSTPLLSLSQSLWGSNQLHTSSLPAVGILMGSFYGSTLGSVTVGLLAILLPWGLPLDPDLIISSAASGFVAAQIAGRLRSREELALLGAGVGLTQALVQLLLNLSLTATPSPVWYLLLKVATLHGLQGMAWCIVALGLSPYLEHLFDLVTPIRLAELSNPNRPLLQRLALEAPGTFQHTLFVATLAEAAARALRCNVELVRAGTLYHDIGKMHDPQGFIENQMDGVNKHDILNNPWQSAEIIKKHVSEGLVMARKYRLPGALQAFIPEHQGTMLIVYFHHQAQQLSQGDPSRHPVEEGEFRYPGPVPQSRETGIVMLADSCEAALRSLKDATPEVALAMVRKIIRGRWQDNQLVDSGLKREEMDKIAEVFVQIWQQFHHKRIPYPTTPAPVLPASPPIFPAV